MGKKSKKRKATCSTKKENACGDQNDLSEEVVKPTLKTLSAQYSAIDLLNKADEFIDTFEYDLARKFCQRALEVEPDNVRALETYGFLELQGGDLDQAKHCFGRAIELQPDVGHSKYMYMGQMTTGQEAVQYFVTGIMLMKKSLTLIDTLQANAATTVSKQTTPRDVSSAYCAIAEIYMTDACDEPDADEKCKQNLDLAIDADPTNAETYHTLASYWLCKGDRQSAVEAMDKGVSLWLPQLRNAVKPEGATLDDPVEVCPLSYPARINCAKTLIELENYEVASEILELLLDENDEVVEVWYLLGLLNYLQGSDFKNNARHYLKKGLELAAKLRFDDADMLSQMNQLLMELGPSTESDDEEDEEQKQGTEDADDGGVEMDSDSDVDDAQQETTNMDH